MTIFDGRESRFGDNDMDSMQMEEDVIEQARSARCELAKRLLGDKGLCPVCGERVVVKSITVEGRLILSCCDAVSITRWVTPSGYEEYFEYLDGLRESGATNMFGARPYLVKVFKLSQPQAARILTAWMKTFEFRHP